MGTLEIVNQPRQTATYLSQRLSDAGLRPVSKYGQNFLIDLNLVDLIADSAGLRKTDVVLEVGTGVGSLTSRLSDAAGAVLSIEIDRNLHQLAGEELEGRPNVKLIQGDALRNKNSLRRDLMDHVRDGDDSNWRRREVPAGRQPALQRGHTDHFEFVASRTAARCDGGYHSEGIGRPHRGAAGKQRLFGALSVWIQSTVPLRKIVRVLATQGVLAATQSTILRSYDLILIQQSARRKSMIWIVLSCKPCAVVVLSSPQVSA